MRLRLLALTRAPRTIRSKSRRGRPVIGSPTASALRTPPCTSCSPPVTASVLVPPRRRPCSTGNGRTGRANSIRSRHTYVSDGLTARRTPGRCGKRSEFRATPVTTVPSAITCDPCVRSRKPSPPSLRLQAILARCPELTALAEHVGTFADMLTSLQGERRGQWLVDVRGDGLPSLHNFAAGLERDLAAVTAGQNLDQSHILRTSVRKFP